MAIEALKEQSTLAELVKKYEVSMISYWKADLVKNAGAVFGRQGNRAPPIRKALLRGNIGLNKGFTLSNQRLPLYSKYFFRSFGAKLAIN